MTADQFMIDIAQPHGVSLAPASETFNSLTDDQFQREVAPGETKNYA